MGYRTKRQVILVPVSKVDEFNKFMERNGYGPAMLVPRDDNAIGASADAKAKAPTHHALELAHADDGIIAAARKALAKCNDKLPEKERGLEKVAFKIPERVLVGKEPVRPILTVDSLAESAGLKKKMDTADVKPVDDGTTPVDAKTK